MPSSSSSEQADRSIAPPFEPAGEQHKHDALRSAASGRSSLGLRVWIGFSVILLSAAALAALRARPSYSLTTFGDLTQLLLVILACGIMAANAFASRGPVRVFWVLLSLAFAFWISSLSMWVYFEVGLHRSVPDIPASDVLVYLKIVPMIAAIGVAPHLDHTRRPRALGYLDLVLLLVYWLYIYVFWVLCYRIAFVDLAIYNFHFDVIDALGNQLLLTFIGYTALRASGPWRTLYLHFFGATALYALSSVLSNVAIDYSTYYTGSLYDLPSVAGLAWFVALGIAAWNFSHVKSPASDPLAEQGQGSSRKVVFWPARLAMFATLSTPLIGVILMFSKENLDALHRFRILTTLFTMLTMTLLLFFKQDLLDVGLTKLLDEVSRAYADLGRFKDRLIQSEKLASLGKLVANVARELEKAMSVIPTYTARIQSTDPSDQGVRNLTTKIDQYAQRTSLLVHKMLGFARETPLESASVDVGPLIDSALKLSRVSRHAHIRVVAREEESALAVKGDASQLLQVFLHIIRNALDAMEGGTPGILTITTRGKNEQVEIEFADTGPGLREPQRVFDPFYTTKPVGKGTGLGLSTCYGIIHQHGGEILCGNRPEGGAVFTLVLPAVSKASEVILA
jgi:signal transduction histidine kinase